MRLRSVITPSGPTAAAVAPNGSVVLTSVLLESSPTTLLDHLVRADLPRIREALERWDGTGAVELPPDAPIRQPGKILGIGLNYGAHAGDLGASVPRTSPASFIKGNHTIVGPGEPIRVPPGIGKVTAEAELGIIFGAECYQVSEQESLGFVAGICAVLDQTAEEVLLENPRFLTRVKNYPTFLSFGPDLITLDEVDDLAQLRVTTIHDGTAHRSDIVAGMTFSPAELISFHSRVMPFYPGDMLLTGTPGAVSIVPGDVVSCELGDGLAVLVNPVV